MLNSNEIIEELYLNGFYRESLNERTKSHQFGHKDMFDKIHVKINHFDTTKTILKPVKKSPLIINPRYLKYKCHFYGMKGVYPNFDSFCHLSSLNGCFDKKLNKGEKPIGYGIEVDIVSRGSLSRLIKFIKINQVDSLTVIDDFVTGKPSFEELIFTEKEHVIKARVGQGVFRKGVVELWSGKCSVTGVDFLNILSASHIKPWRDSSNKERLDPNNGLLLIPNLDFAFDKGFVTFSNKGEVLVSPKFNLYSERLGINPTMKLRVMPTMKQQEYLDWHQRYIFKG